MCCDARVEWMLLSESNGYCVVPRVSVSTGTVSAGLLAGSPDVRVGSTGIRVGAVTSGAGAASTMIGATSTGAGAAGDATVVRTHVAADVRPEQLNRF